jgi:CubicO group peptidase (beta-lactamase class C family)
MSTPIQAALQPYVDRHALPGAVALVADRDGVLSLDTVGWADIAAAAPMRADSTCWMASTTKPVTAAAVMMLVEEGRLRLDDAVEQYLPEFAGQRVIAERDEEHVLLRRPGHAITVREILSHTSGLSFATPLELACGIDRLPLEFAVRSYAAAPLEFEPGTQYLYSNEGINTAARILEVVSGRSYEDFLQERLFDPLGMTDTTFWPNPEQVSRLAKVYRPDEAGTDIVEMPLPWMTAPLTDRTVRFPCPGGGLFAAAADFAQFGRMLLRGGELDGRRYLSQASVDTMATRQTPPHLAESYGLGCGVAETWFGHGGALGTNLTVDRGAGLVFVWMVQVNGWALDGEQAQGAFQRAAKEVAAG